MDNATVVCEAVRAGGNGHAPTARTARAKSRLDLRNALLPVVTVPGLDFGSYLTGSILTETIFFWPGVGRYVLTAIDRRDLPAVQGSILSSAWLNLDPRVAYD